MLKALVSVLLVASPMRVAVLPFENATQDPQLEVLRVGLADLVATDLAGAEPLEVVERARFAEVLKELQLQQTKYFDATQAVQLGKGLSATHLVTGTLVAVAPKVRIAVRVIEVKGGAVISTATVTGTPADLFELEASLVQQLVTALRAKLEATRSGHASLGTLVTWSQGVDLADRGELDAAKSKLAEAVRSGPDFTLGKERYAEILKRLREAQKKHGSGIEEASQVLRARLLPQLGKPPVERALAVRAALANLALLELARVVGAQPERANYVPPEKRAQVERLEAEFVLHASALVAELRPVRQQHLDLTLADEDAALGAQVFGIELGDWDFATPTSVASDLGNFLGSGWTPYRSAVPQFVLRPSPAQRAPAQLEAARRWFALARKEIPFELEETRPLLAGKVANEQAEMLVLLGHPEEAVAQWQGFLDAYPADLSFAAYSKKLEAVMLLDDQAEREERQVKACDAAVLEQGAELMTRTWRAKGRAGLVTLGEALTKCSKKEPKFERASWVLVAAELRRVADCEGFEAWRLRAVKAGVGLEACP